MNAVNVLITGFSSVKPGYVIDIQDNNLFHEVKATNVNLVWKNKGKLFLWLTIN